ncbi:MAG: SDR family NAD(P)-dependent oxidoreductase [Chloroflexota bacterium]|nr:SDR family NAD(P)-dependent oxidoreductase [Chloroflexota bacterium]
MQLEDKIALVTGAGRGMGRAISLQLAEVGCNVAVSDIDVSTAEDTPWP